MVQSPDRLPVWLMCINLIMALLVVSVDTVAVIWPRGPLRAGISRNSGCIDTEQWETLHLAAWGAKPSVAPSPAASNGVGEIVVPVADVEVAIRATAEFLANCTKSESVAACFIPPGVTPMVTLAAIAPPAP